MENLPTIDFENLDAKKTDILTKIIDSESTLKVKLVKRNTTKKEKRNILELKSIITNNDVVSDVDSDSDHKSESKLVVAVPSSDFCQRIRDMDFEPRKYPKCIDSHVARRFLKVNMENPKTSCGEASFTPEAADHCVICGENNNQSEMVTCRGFMEGLMGRGKSKIRCKSIFHLECILNYNASDYNLPYIIQPECQNDILCPLHFCDTCYFERRKQTAFSGPLIECAFCLRSFHYDKCAPIGGKDLELTLKKDDQKYKIEMVICPAHRTNSVNKAFVRISICCDCENTKDEELVKCTRCVRSFHASCRSAELIDNIPVAPDICEFCLTGECIRYDSLIVARWTDNKFYPAYTRDWSKCPNKLRRDPRYDQLGFCVIEWKEDNNYSISTIGDCVPMFASFYKICAKKSKLAKNPKEFIRLMQNSDACLNLPPVLKEVRKKTDTSKYMYQNWDKSGPFLETDKYVCDCAPFSPNRCSTDSCNNRREYYECPPECNEKGKCHNRGISEKEVNSKIERRATVHKGYGVFAKEPIKRGEFIAEYAGEIINKKEIDKRNTMICNARDNEANLYMMALGQGRAVDAARMGNVARYINHSCDPNCQTVKRSIIIKVRRNEVVYDHRIAIVAIRDIQIDEEVSFTYLMDVCVNTEAPRCKCGANNCRGSLDGTNKIVEVESDIDHFIDGEQESPLDNDKDLETKKKSTGRAGKRQKVAKKTSAKKSKISVDVPDDTRESFLTSNGLFKAANSRDRKGAMITMHELLGRTCDENDEVSVKEFTKLSNISKSEYSTIAWLKSKIEEDVTRENVEYNSAMSNEHEIVTSEGLTSDAGDTVGEINMDEKKDENSKSRKRDTKTRSSRLKKNESTKSLSDKTSLRSSKKKHVSK